MIDNDTKGYFFFGNVSQSVIHRKARGSKQARHWVQSGIRSWILRLMVFSVLTAMMDLCCRLQEGPESMAVRVEEASKQYGAVCNFWEEILRTWRLVWEAFGSPLLQRVCRINRSIMSVWTGNEGGAEGPIRAKYDPTGDWQDSRVEFCVLLLDRDCNDQRFSSGHATNDGHRTPDQGAPSLSLSLSLSLSPSLALSLSLCLSLSVAASKKHKLWNLVDRLHPLRRWRNERGPPNPRARQAMRNDKPAESG